MEGGPGHWQEDLGHREAGLAAETGRSRARQQRRRRSDGEQGTGSDRQWGAAVTSEEVTQLSRGQ